MTQFGQIRAFEATKVPEFSIHERCAMQKKLDFFAKIWYIA